MPDILSKKINILASPATQATTNPHIDPIYLIYQFFVHKDVSRHGELQLALKMNVQNPLVSKIYLLNERIYTKDELGLESKKIKQIVLGKRLTFKNVFDFIQGDNLKGYCVTCNADIFLDGSLENLYKSGIDKQKTVYAQLRFDCIPGKSVGHSRIFCSSYKEPRADSQDTWIIHSNFNLTKKERKLFNFNYGMRGCDNKITYLFYLLGYNVINQPFFIKTFHLHNTGIRGYDKNSPMLYGPYLQIGPYIKTKTLEMASYPAPFNSQQHFKFDVKCYWKNNTNRLMEITYGNERLREFIEERNKTPNIAWNIALLDPVIMKLMRAGLRLQAEENEIRCKMIVQEINRLLPLMKTTNGILLQTNKDYQQFCIANFGAMEGSDLCIGYTHLDHMWSFMGHDHIDIYKILKQKKIPFITRDGLDIYQYIHSNPWTLQLRGKRILVIAPFIDQMKERVNKKEIYDYDFFPDCKFSFIESPRTYKNSETNDFQKEIEQLANKILAVRDQFDIALVACNGFSGMVGDYIKKIGKCSISVGNLIYLWFGVYTKNDLKYRSDIIKLNMNKNWCQLDAPESESMFEYSW